MTFYEKIISTKDNMDFLDTVPDHIFINVIHDSDSIGLMMDQLESICYKYFILEYPQYGYMFEGMTKEDFKFYLEERFGGESEVIYMG